MPSSNIRCGKKVAAWSLAIAAGLAVSFAFLYIWGMVGFFTRVIDMSSDAPQWWKVAYMWLTPIVIVPGSLATRATYRWFVEKDQSKM